MTLYEGDTMTNDLMASCKLQGIYIHPSHMASGLAGTAFSDEEAESDLDLVAQLELEDAHSAPDSPASLTSSLWSLQSGHSSASSVGGDYFGCVVGVSDKDDATMRDDKDDDDEEAESSKNSFGSGASTPTCDANQFLNVTAFTSPPLPSPQIMSNSRFASRLSLSLQAETSKSASMARTTSSSSRMGEGGANMLRSVSLPVETFKQLEKRRNALKAVTAVVADRLSTSPDMARSQTLHVDASRSPCSSTAPSFGSVFANSENKKTPFGDGWGHALPPRVQESEPLVPFPYNLVTPKSPPRLMRSHSTSDVIFNSPRSSTHSSTTSSSSSNATKTKASSTSSPPSPTSASSPFSSSTTTNGSSSSGAASPMLISRSRRPTWMSPLTPIVGSPPNHDDDYAAFMHYSAAAATQAAPERPPLGPRVSSSYQ